jgi:hypothetical protein
MRSLIVITILCLTSTAAFACVFDNDCKPGSVCLDGVCSGNLNSDNANDDVPRSERLGRAASTTVIAAMMPIASRAQV